MAKGRTRLGSDCKKAAKPGMHADGKGLYLQVREGSTKGSVSKAWIYRYAAPATGREQML